VKVTVGDARGMTVDVRTLRDVELSAAFALLSRAFGEPAHPEDVEVEVALVDPARAYGAELDGRLVATAASFAFSMAVPGGVVPLAGVTWVGVLPTYRRRGLLGALLERQLSDLHGTGTAVAALWASEGAIYGRYGYGPAAWNLSVGLRRGAAFRLPVPPGRLDLVDPRPDLLAEVYERVAARTPGFVSRDDRWWAYRVHDPEHARDGATELQCVVTDGGYALYAVQGRWTDGLPAAVVHVRELVAEDLPARLRLWRHLLDLDLTAEVRARAVAPDDPLLLSALAEPRAAGARIRDSLWVRLVDLPDALRSRTYACDVDVVLEVVDDRAPWNTGRWRLTGDRTDATCLRTRAAADLVLRPEDLGAAYLGGTPLRARPVEERRPGALDVVSTAFGPTGAAPWCPLVF
jgi:predicted acetyltransferase